MAAECAHRLDGTVVDDGRRAAERAEDDGEMSEIHIRALWSESHRGG